MLALESRRAEEVRALIATYGGEPMVAPALREVPIAGNAAALDFAAALIDGRFDLVVFLTGVGVRSLVEAIAPAVPAARLVEALGRIKVVARGPKPTAALRELRVPVWATVPEPSTWHELVALVDERLGRAALSGMRVAVQEYGASNPDLIAALAERGAHVTPVPVYRWALPEDLGPLEAAVAALAEGRVDVALFTTGVQVQHLWRVAADRRAESAVREGLLRAVIGSIGPTTSAELRRHGVAVDVEASHPKFGLLVRELAERAGAIAGAKRAVRGR